MAEYYKFDDKAVENAIAAAQADFGREGVHGLAATEHGGVRGEMSLLAECVKVTVEDHKVCVELPLGLGKHCISIPVSIPDGTAGQACLRICTTWGIPTGVEVSVVIGGITIVSQKFGKC
jgi:hypothetical protein